MSYHAAIQSLFGMTPELHTNPGQPRRKFSLEEFGIFLQALGDPQKLFPSVLIAGTNGKGSTAATLASILNASGVRAGLYTSPHLQRVNERITIGINQIGDDDFAHLYFRAYDVAQTLVEAKRLPQFPSFFEILTAQAMLYFAEQKVELAVLEVGMGGRLDATNLVDPLFSVITDISLDHTEWLGSTLAAITKEKAGILRPGKTLITLPQNLEVNETLSSIAKELGVNSVDASVWMPVGGCPDQVHPSVTVLGASVEVASPLQGDHQRRNVALAIAAAVELAKEHGFSVTAESIQEGVRKTCWPGRLERFVKDGVEWILDVAHNPAGAEALQSALSKILAESNVKILVFSCLRDKPLRQIAHILFPIFDQVILAPIHSTRATNMEDLEAAALETGTPTVSAASVEQALALASERAKGGCVVVSGSVYLVGEIRSLLQDGGIG
jgi:dihydrofolate synthase/folylpolyglutamate synthase